MKNFETINLRTLLIAVASAACALLHTSCQLPPRQVLSSLQRDGLIGYLSRSHEERRLLAQEVQVVRDEDTRQLTDVARGESEETRGFVGRVPVASTVPGRPGSVYSPHASGRRLVDVSGFEPGAEVLCPYTRKAFRIPLNLDQPVSEVQVVEQTPYPTTPRIVAPRTVRTKPVTPPEPESPRTAEANIPYATRIPGKANLVYSPYASKTQVVNVEGMVPGSKVRCPYTGKLFRIPAGLAAAGQGNAEPSTPTTGKRLGTTKPEAKPKSKPMPRPEVKTEETTPAPEPKPESKPEVKLQPESKPAPTTPAPKPAAAPTASWADGKPGYVVSPYGNFLVDVRGKSAGAVERCPFSGKLFKVPAK